MTKYVYSFEEGNKSMKETLGGKGANLAEMSSLGINVPPGYTTSRIRPLWRGDLHAGHDGHCP